MIQIVISLDLLHVILKIAKAFQTYSVLWPISIRIINMSHTNMIIKIGADLAPIFFLAKSQF